MNEDNTVHNKDYDPAELQIVSTSTYQLCCPYCKKTLQAQYIKQVNQHYAEHVKSCKLKSLSVEKPKKEETTKEILNSMGVSFPALTENEEVKE